MKWLKTCCLEKDKIFQFYQFEINIKKFLSLKLDKIDFLVYKKISFYQFQI